MRWTRGLRFGPQPLDGKGPLPASESLSNRILNSEWLDSHIVWCRIHVGSKTRSHTEFINFPNQQLENA